MMILSDLYEFEIFTKPSGELKDNLEVILEMSEVLCIKVDGNSVWNVYGIAPCLKISELKKRCNGRAWTGIGEYSWYLDELLIKENGKSVNITCIKTGLCVKSVTEPNLHLNKVNCLEQLISHLEG